MAEATAQLMDIAPKEICLIGLQPNTIALGLELTELIQKKLPDLVAMIIKQLEDWGIRCSRHPR